MNINDVMKRIENVQRSDKDFSSFVDFYGPLIISNGGALSGRFCAIKSNISLANYRQTGGIEAYSENIRKHSAVVAQRLEAAGAIIIGSVNMEEGALGAQTDNPWFGKTFNPLKAGYTPGGSSGGSAAAVAAKFVDFSLGTDTMGSVRIPSSYCGLWGFKPSHDYEMLEGVMPLSPTLDTVGAHGNSLADVTAVTEIICNRDFSRGKAGSITVLDWEQNVKCEDDVQGCFDQFIAKLGALQATDLAPYAFTKSRKVGLVVSEVEGYEFHKPMLKTNPEGFSDFFRGMLEYGHNLPKRKVEAAYAHLNELRESDFADFILMPTAPQTAFKFGDPVPANQADFTAFANLADRPAIQFPIGVNSDGLPIGAQLIGPRGREADLIATVKSLPIS